MNKIIKFVLIYNWYKIEAKNGELKNVHGYARAVSYGIENMQMQGALTIFAVNLKRILKLI